MKITRGPFAGKRVVPASIKEIAPYRERVLDMLAVCFGVEGAWISDESTFEDFRPYLSTEGFAMLAEDYGVVASPSDTLLEIAKLIWK